MIRENGLYVLMGSKPMSTFYIYSGFPKTEEEFRRYYESFQAGLKADNLSEYMTDDYEQFKKDCLSNRLRHEKHESLWEIWQKKMKDYAISPKFKFIARRAPFGDRVIEGLFINVPSTLYILKFHYDAFSRITGMSFDTDTILNEISDDSSVFWEKAFQSHYLMGLLFGYGERNAVFFEWEMKNNYSLPSIRIYDQRKDIDEIVEFTVKKMYRFPI